MFDIGQELRLAEFRERRRKELAFDSDEYDHVPKLGTLERSVPVYVFSTGHTERAPRSFFRSVLSTYGKEIIREAAREVKLDLELLGIRSMHGMQIAYGPRSPASFDVATVLSSQFSDVLRLREEPSLGNDFTDYRYHFDPFWPSNVLKPSHKESIWECINRQTEPIILVTGLSRSELHGSIISIVRAGKFASGAFYRVMNDRRVYFDASTDYHRLWLDSKEKSEQVKP